MGYKLRVIHIVYTALILLALSFLSYFYPIASIIGFFAFGVFMIALGLYRREYMLYLAFLELCLGSFGYMLSFSHISLRMLFFGIIMAIWIIDTIRKKNNTQYPFPNIFLLIFGIIWLFAIIQGYWRGYELLNIFFDANSYLYLLLLLPALSYINTKEKLKNLLRVVLTGGAILAVGTIALFLTFTYCKIPHFLEVLYKWLRDFRLAEITPLDSGSYRIFLQSQIYLLAGLFILSVKYFFEKFSFWKYSALIALFGAGIYISLSRSLWVGIVLAMVVFFISIKFLAKKKIIKNATTLFLSFFIGVLIVSLFAKGNLTAERLEAGKSAGNTRIEQLSVLLPTIKSSPIFGYGFGKTLTFISKDPRINGPYTTYAFEWGYLDMILKYGILGLSVFLGFIFLIFSQALKYKNILVLVLLASVLTVHIFTPYLNHPLGIGILLLTFLLNYDKKRKIEGESYAP